MNSVLGKFGPSAGFGDRSFRFIDSRGFDMTIVRLASNSLCETGNAFGDRSSSRFTDSFAICAGSYAINPSSVLESAMAVPDSDDIDESGLLGDFAVSEVLYDSADVALSGLLLTEVLRISTIMKQSILQWITPIVEITFAIADTKCVSDESASKLGSSTQVDSKTSWFGGPLPTEYRKAALNNRSLALAVGLGLGVLFVLLILGGVFLCRMMRQDSNKDSCEEEIAFEIEASSNTGASWTGDDYLASCDNILASDCEQFVDLSVEPSSNSVE
jgi:hypothetical protein